MEFPKLLAPSSFPYIRAAEKEKPRRPQSTLGPPLPASAGEGGVGSSRCPTSLYREEADTLGEWQRLLLASLSALAALTE